MGKYYCVDVGRLSMGFTEFSQQVLKRGVDPVLV